MDFNRDVSGRNSFGTRRVQSRLRLTAALLLSLWSGVVLAGNLDRIVLFNIRSNTLDKALIQFGEQAHVQIVFATKATAVKMGQEELKGRFTGRQALTDLLRGSQLEFVDNGSRVEIVPRRAAMTSGRLTEPEDPSRQGGHKQKHADDGVNLRRHGGHASENQNIAVLEQVIVTGTHIADVEPTSPVATITAEEIADSGLPDVASVIRSLPEFYSGGQNPDAVVGGGLNGGSELSDISTANLRGIGGHATLTLLDGHNLSGSGADDFVDISAIPTAAVKRVEIETGGASAIYGADAVAGVVNIILRKNYNGENTDAYVGGTMDGGLIQRYSQLVGRTFEQGAAGVMLGYQFQSSDEILDSQRAVSRTAGVAYTLQPQDKSNSLFLSSHFDAADGVSAHLEGFYNHRTSLNRFDTTEQQAVEDQFAATGGLTASAGADRTVNLDVTSAGDSAGSLFYAPSTPAYARESVQNRLLQFSLSEQGTLLRLPGKRIVRSAVGAGFTRESFDAVLPPPLRAGRRREHAYAEVNIPVVPESTRRVGLERLTVSAAGRFEHYSDFGSTTVPKVGIAYSPARAITFSGTWGRSFQTPTLGDLYLGQFFIRYPGSFFGLPAGREVLLVTGSNPDLKPQTATTRTLSVRWRPLSGSLRGLSVSASYYDIDFSHVINVPIIDLADALSNPLIAPFVVENPSVPVQNAAAAGAELDFNPFGLPVNPAAVQALVYNNSHNLSEEVIHGVDTDVAYRVPTKMGELMVDAKVSWERFDQQLIPGAGLQQIAGTVFNPPHARARIMFGWRRRNVGASLFVNYLSGELNTAENPSSEVPSWTTVDGQVRYDIASIKLRLSVQNLLNHAPPGISAASTVPPGIGFDADNYSAIGRFFAFEVSTDWGG